MASPSEAEIQQQLKNFINILEKRRNDAGVTSTTNYLAQEDVAVQAVEGEYAMASVGKLEAYRAKLADVNEQGADLILPLLLEYGKNLAIAEQDTKTIFSRLRDNFVANSKTIKSRGFSFGTPSAGGANVGNGTFNRLNVDQDNKTIERQTADSKTAECMQDLNSGASKHGEIFVFRGGIKERDRLRITGSGKIENKAALSALDSTNYLNNPSFHLYTGPTSVPTDITDWTVSTALTSFEIDTTNYYRDYDGESPPASLIIKANDGVTQKFSVRRPTFDPAIPYYLQIAYNRQIGTGDGTLTLTLGSQTAAVVLAAQTGWNILRLAIGQKNWFKTWNQADPGISIVLSGRSTGYVNVDDVCFFPYQEFDGSWYAPVGGATRWLKGDTFSWSDTETGAILQYWFWRLFNEYLIGDASPSISDPT